MSEIASEDLADLHASFLRSHDLIRGHGHNRFSRLHGDDREDKIAETVALAWENYRKLFLKGRDVEDIRGAIAVFAGKAVSSGGRLVGANPVNDVMSPTFKHGHSLGRPRDHEKTEGCHVSQSILNVDVEAWLDTLSPVLRQVALLLREGKTNEQIGAVFGFSRGWTSLRRQELREAWRIFFGEDPLA